MHGLKCEIYEIKGDTGATFIASHLSKTALYGKIAIISRKPHATMSAVRKQWLKIIRKRHRERASTLDAKHIDRITETVDYMETLRFTLRYPDGDYPGDVYIVNPDQALKAPPSCQTIYIACNLEPEELHMITAWMPKDALVVILESENSE